MQKHATRFIPDSGTLIAPDTIRFQRRLNAPIAEIWAWLTESDKRGRWLAKGRMDLVEGGAVTLHFHHRDLSPLPGNPPEKYKSMEDGHSFTGKILKVDPPRLLSFTWEGDSEVTFELTETKGAVLLTVTHRRLPADPASRASVLGGWHTHLEIMIAAMHGRTPPNFWLLHTRLEEDYAN
ncbi:MAG TPA: SRPBCC family protein [Puia sp.]|nr:SRPBCC family protein [Puia sp.]